jgi:toxin YoeB
MNNISFSNRAWGEYLYWQNQDKKTLKRINLLLQDILKNKYEGLGKPEPLKGNLSGLWSRRIDEVNRIVYKISNDEIKIYQCKGHYKN